MLEDRRKRISRYYFELAEKCPDWFAERIRAVNYLKGHPFLEQQPESLGESELLRTINPHEIYLFEVYGPEKFDKLERGAEKLFSESNLFLAEIDRYSKFFDELYRPTWGRWKEIGSIFSPEASPTISRPKAFRDLPEMVNRVDVSVHQVLPSLAVVLGRVILSEKIKDKIKEIITSEYREQAELSSLKPWQVHKSSIKFLGPNQQRKDKFENLLDELQKGVESILKNNFSSGYFLSSVNNSTKYPKCPSYRVFLAKPYEPVIRILAASNYRDKHRQILECFSVGPMDALFSGVYIGQNSIFIKDPATVWREDERKFPIRTIIGLPELLTEKDILNNNPQFSSLYRIHELIKYHIYYFSLDSLLTQLSSEVADNRKSAFAEAGLEKNFEDLTRVNQEVARSEILLESLEEDLANHKESITHYLEDLPVKLKSLKGNNSTSPYLLDHLEKRIERQIELIKTQSSLATRSIENEVALKNIEVNYQLQRRVVWLSIGLLFLAALQAYNLISWHDLASIFMKIPYYWSKAIPGVLNFF